MSDNLSCTVSVKIQFEITEVTKRFTGFLYITTFFGLLCDQQSTSFLEYGI